MTRKHTPLLLFLVCVSLPARASLSYPGVIEEAWGVDTLPVRGEGCLLCHTTEPGRAGTATRPFAVTIIDRGVRGASPGRLGPVLFDIAQDGDDSDGDGASDY